MSEIIDSIGIRFGGLIPSAELQMAGLSSHVVAKLVARGTLVRIRRGVYADGALWRTVQAEQRYRMLVLATAHLAQTSQVYSHLSAAALHGLPLIGAWPNSVHTSQPGDSTGNTARFTTRHRCAGVLDTVEIAGRTVTTVQRTLVDVAASQSFLVAVTMIDHVLHQELMRVEKASRSRIVVPPALTTDDLLSELERVHPYAGMRRAEQAITFSSGLAETPGESLSRVRIYELGFEVPELQVNFVGTDGRSYWVDFLWRRIRKIGEFDGLHKYLRGAILGDRDPGEVVIAEKRRERALRRHWHSFTRWEWDTAISPRRFYDFLSEHEVPRV
ncbi:hypothetical protein [Glaciibacter psychrotolerans]|uniref:Type IV toxin-antitoxin system AbiEi family antitoxin domain-containing protein n=1 Tax=Glaciibacter psychrotolerans TaxID=670054 RepID=A0A7Z0J6S8_9MICO|nr:hypothetical protein [Leifsonia psychrotolerans]NYJ20857.1 hypothetical protein [Leifsonia psychrotolerans]